MDFFSRQYSNFLIPTKYWLGLFARRKCWWRVDEMNKSFLVDDVVILISSERVTWPWTRVKWRPNRIASPIDLETCQNQDQPIGRQRIVHHEHLTHSRNSFAVGRTSKRGEFRHVVYRNMLWWNQSRHLTVRCTSHVSTLQLVSHCHLLIRQNCKCTNRNCSKREQRRKRKKKIRSLSPLLPFPPLLKRNMT